MSFTSKRGPWKAMDPNYYFPPKWELLGPGENAPIFMNQPTVEKKKQQK